MLRQRSTSKGKNFDRLVPEKVNLSDYQFHMVEDLKCQSAKEFDLNEQLRMESSQAKYSNLLRQKILENKTQQSLFVYQRQPSRYRPYIFENECPSPVREIPKTPYKILDAPKLRDDFYYQLVDWSMNNQIGVILDNSVYTWNAITNHTVQLLEIESPASFSAVKWCDRNEILAIGDDSGTVRIYDVVKAKILKTYDNHNQRVGCLDWNGFCVTSGSRDKSILMADIRTNNDFEIQFQSHKQEVCGIEWSPNDQLLASGGNDNAVMIQSIKMPNQSLFVFRDHVAAVKALAWSPHQPNMLCSGGGSTDKCLKFWNTSNGKLQNSVDTGSQICNMKWSTNSNELVTSHGFSLNQVAVWKMPKVERIATLYGHSFRVLYLSLSPDGENIVTGSGDETLRFWKIFPQKRINSISTSLSELENVRLDIR